MTKINMEEYKKILRSVENDLKNINMQQKEFNASEDDISKNRLEKR